MNAKAGSALIAINAAIPQIIARSFEVMPDSWPWFGLFLISVALIFAMNYRLGISLPETRRTIWILQTLNIASAVLIGSVAFFNTLPNLPFFLRLL